MNVNADYKIPEKWGWCMEGNQEAIAAAIARAAARSKADVFRYLEIGVAKLGTVKAVIELLKSMDLRHEVVGLELPSDPFDIMQETIEMEETESFKMLWTESAQMLNFAGNLFDVILIDGCHCDECATQDFVNAEQLIKPTGAIIAHDASPLCQEWDLQRFHDNRPLRVRRALSRLGLFNAARPGWKLARDLQEVPNGVAIFERSEEVGE